MSVTLATIRKTTEEGVEFLDLNGNGTMEPYEDPRLPVQERVADLVARLSIQEKAGLMFQTMTSVAPTGEIRDDVSRVGRSKLADVIGVKLVNHLNVHSMPEPRTMVKWVNRLQEHAITSTPHGIPVTLSTDPRHSFADNWGASFFAEHFSAWPEPLGLAALRDEDAVREFARVARAEYTAVGLRAALHPTIDLASEPRWARQYGTFGQDPELAARLALAYLDGFEGPSLDGASVACMAKHFPGGGPQMDGEDPHFPYGREQVYPDGAFEAHLAPFRAVIERGVSAIMPYYGMPMGLVRNGEPIEQVGFGFNKQIITGLLREELGYQGVVCTDWGLVTESQLGGESLPPRSWGVEHLSEEALVSKILEAGCDQLGGEECPEHIVALVEKGLVSEDRIDESVARLLKVKFELGLFDDPFVDEEAAERTTQTPELVEAGLKAQARTATLLKNDDVLPLSSGTRVYCEGMDPAALTAAGLSHVASPEDADIALVRHDTPFEPRDEYMLESAFRAGSLEFAEESVNGLGELSESVPVALIVHLDRPAVLSRVEPFSSAILGVYGSSDQALLRVLTGEASPEGKLPFDLPRSMQAVVGSNPDAIGDPDPLYKFGDGLRYESSSAIDR